MGRGQERTSSKDSAVLCNQACAVAPGELENYELYKRMKGWDYSIHKQSMERPEINLMRLSKFVFCRPYIIYTKKLLYFLSQSCLHASLSFFIRGDVDHVSRSNWNVKMLLFVEEQKLEHPGKIFEARLELTTNSVRTAPGWNRTWTTLRV